MKGAKLGLSVLIFAVHFSSSASASASASPKVNKQKISNETLTGCWFFGGNDEVSTAKVEGIVRRNPDGAFATRFVTIKPNGLLEYGSESGWWAVNANRLLTVTASVNGDPAAYADAYNVLSVDTQKVTYQHTGGSERIWQSQRSDCDLKLPRQ